MYVCILYFSVCVFFLTTHGIVDKGHCIEVGGDYLEGD